MKLIKIRFLSLIPVVYAIVLTTNALALTMAVPAGQQIFPMYNPIVSPIMSVDPSQAMPIGVGPVATGGDTINIQVGLGQFSGPVDIYFGIYSILIDPDNVYILTSENTFQPISVEFTPWIAGTSGNINESLFGDISASALLSGTYYLYLAVTPVGSLDDYYFWTTEFTTPQPPGNNVLPITVNGSLCSPNSYPNKPCVSVTICTPGTSTCQTINDILLDTGSFGLRIFKQTLNVSLPQATVNSRLLAECVQFADGSSLWGPVQTAGVILGNEPSVDVPVHVIDSTFGTLPFVCQNANKSPDDAGYNGILGVGFFAEDCGSICEISANNRMYYSCNGTLCRGTSIALSSQVQNPVLHLPQDNNGLIVQLPGVPPEGSSSLTGNLVLGIGTRSNNLPSAVTAYPTNKFGEFTTDFNGISYSSFIDSGSNGLFFVPPLTNLLPNCFPPNSAWFCPASITNLSATNTGAFGSPSGAVSFRIGNAISLFNSSNRVFDDIGGAFLVNEFDWGLPFFFGRNVYIGFEGKEASLGTGPYWAY